MSKIYIGFHRKENQLVAANDAPTAAPRSALLSRHDCSYDEVFADYSHPLLVA